MIKAVLFDMDGVLIDSYEAWFDRFNASLKHFGLQEISKEEFDKNVWAISFKENTKNYFPGVPLDQIMDYYNKTFDKLIEKIKKIENVDKILEYIKNKNLKLAVASSTPSHIIKKILTKQGIINYFDEIVGGEQVKHPKPDPEIILVACNELKLKPEETIFVGDSIYDKKAAEAAGCIFIGYKIKGDKRIDDLKKLREVIQNVS